MSQLALQLPGSNGTANASIGIKKPKVVNVNRLNSGAKHVGERRIASVWSVLSNWRKIFTHFVVLVLVMIVTKNILRCAALIRVLIKDSLIMFYAPFRVLEILTTFSGSFNL